ncbi:hypothetical protein NDU88_006240 [Pleurodeles waltl]|uniref:Uncharacterized protein n=1 Tax=Pleurodeles waltl TaxID=8319 RepID=A0AAV7MYM7_PLEWA|nr:hypothetical protein NDU88_006240 [Pleurodeles waltl]
MAGYEDQAEDLYYLDEPAGSFDQDLVYALDAGVRHTVNQALAQAIQPIKHHLLGFVEQGWVAPSGIQPIGELPLPAKTQASNQSTNPHSADFESLIRNMSREHDYNSGSQKKAVSDPVSSSSEQSSEQGDDPPRKRKKKEMTRSKFRSVLAPADKVVLGSAGVPACILSQKLNVELNDSGSQLEMKSASPPLITALRLEAYAAKTLRMPLSWCDYILLSLVPGGVAMEEEP